MRGYVLICVNGFDETGTKLLSEIPQWPEVTGFKLDLSQLPQDLQEQMNVSGFPFWLMADTDSYAQEPQLTNFRVAPEPDPNDGLA